MNAAANEYYGTTELLAVAGSQAAIQNLPALCPPTQVALVAPSYAEHAHAWQRHGHQVHNVPATEILRVGTNIKVVVIVNPNNPTGVLFSQRRIAWFACAAGGARRLAGGGRSLHGCHARTQPRICLPASGADRTAFAGKILRSSRGARRFRAGRRKLLRPLADLLGPWPVAAPSRFAATLALRDTAWQRSTRKSLPLAAQRLADLLSASFNAEWRLHAVSMGVQCRCRERT